MKSISFLCDTIQMNQDSFWDWKFFFTFRNKAGAAVWTGGRALLRYDKNRLAWAQLDDTN
jgi:hypothetical protein